MYMQSRRLCTSHGSYNVHACRLVLAYRTHRAMDLYLHVIGDYFTKRKEAYPIKNMEATTVARILVHKYICRFGVPEHLYTDQGRNFEAELIKGICTLLDIEKTRTTLYHPQSDGMINRTLLSMLSTAVDQDQKSWDLQLPVLMLAYRTSMQETTRATPFFLMFSHHAKLPIDLEFNLPTHLHVYP